MDRLGLSIRATFAVMLAGSVVFVAGGLLILYIPGRHAALVYAAIGLLFVGVVWRLGFLRMTPDEKAAADRYLAEHRRR